MRYSSFVAHVKKLSIQALPCVEIRRIYSKRRRMAAKLLDVLSNSSFSHNIAAYRRFRTSSPSGQHQDMEGDLKCRVELFSLFLPSGY